MQILVIILYFFCIPDDQTRVCLTPTTSEYESDYINASFIKVLQCFNFNISYLEHYVIRKKAFKNVVVHFVQYV